jgi:hypothetical protein
LISQMSEYCLTQTEHFCYIMASSGVGRVGMIWKLIFGEGSTGAA